MEKKKKLTTQIKPRPRTAMFLEGENGMTNPASIHCVGNSRIPTNARKKDGITISLFLQLLIQKIFARTLKL